MTLTPRADDRAPEAAHSESAIGQQAGQTPGTKSGSQPGPSTAAPAATSNDAPASHAGGHRHDLSHMLFSHSVPGTEVKRQISYIAPGQTAKALILIYLTFSVPVVLISLVNGIFRMDGEIDLRIVATRFFSALLLNAILGYVLLWIACRAYNWVASRFGGIEITLSEVPKDL